MSRNQQKHVGLKAVAIAAALAVMPLFATAQTVENLTVGQQIQLQGPPGSNRSALMSYLGGATELSFGSGLYKQTGVFDDIGGALGALNVGNLQVGGVNGTTASVQFGVNGLGEAVRTSLQTTTGITSLDMRVSGPGVGTFESLSWAGGLTISGTRISGTLTGGQLQISQVRVDLASGQVVADLSGTRGAVGAPTAVFNAPNTVFWTFDPVADVVGPSKIEPSSLLAADPVSALTADGFTVLCEGPSAPCFSYIVKSEFTLNNLAITTMGAQLLADSLGLLATGQGALNAVNSSEGKWGSIRSSLTFQTALPEPSTYALMGLGLVGIALAVRRARAQQT